MHAGKTSEKVLSDFLKRRIGFYGQAPNIFTLPQRIERKRPHKDDVEHAKMSFKTHSFTSYLPS